MARGQVGAGAAIATLLVLALVALIVIPEDDDGRVTAAGSVPVTTVTSATAAPPSTVPAPTTSVAPAPAITSSAPATTAPPAAPPDTVSTGPAGDSLATTAGAHGPMQAALTAARQRWLAGRPAQGYVWVYERSCRCSPRKVEATVDGGGSVISARSLDRGATEPVVGALTVDAVLAQLQEAIDGNAASIGARFDPVLGLPTFSSVDRSTAVADEERGLSVSAFSPRSA